MADNGGFTVYLLKICTPKNSNKNLANIPYQIPIRLNATERVKFFILIIFILHKNFSFLCS